MAVKPTPNNNLYKGLVFDGVDSRDYGIYITGDAVFNSPERDVEMIEIPGRNGAYALDKGRFSNIEVSYPAGIFGDTEADFRQGIRAFRNALASRKGYKRLEDDYNPTEYRMAVYKSGLEVTPTALKAGEFTITFDCQPQRFLKSGETAVSVASGGTLTNPTLFESSPLLYVQGYGNITLEDSTITIFQPRPIGTVTLYDNTIAVNTLGFTIPLSRTQFNTGDSFTFTSKSIPIEHYYSNPRKTRNVTVSSSNPLFYAESPTSVGSASIRFIVKTASPLQFVIGTAKTESVTFTVTVAGTPTLTTTFTVNISYNPTRNFIKIEQMTDEDALFYGQFNALVVGYSSVIIPSDYYIDCDLGEAWHEESGEIIPANNVVALPAVLPVLKSGANGFTYDNTITRVDVTPRWWEV